MNNNCTKEKPFRGFTIVVALFLTGNQSVTQLHNLVDMFHPTCLFTDIGLMGKFCDKGLAC